MDGHEPSDRIEVTVEKGPDGRPDVVTVNFGRHCFAQIMRENGRVFCSVGATHHGFRVNGSGIGCDLENVTQIVANARPDLAF
ncbi:MAG: hypothetical protein FJ087_10755 [Deltaproteobacteria bacterium]|nr:hypothetical protein [Deltaproteobacteria bacterium]